MAKNKSKNLESPEKRLSFWQKEKGETIINISLIIFLSVSITFLMTLYIDKLPQRLSVGSISTKNLKSDQNYEIIDEKTTAKLREEALQRVKPVYDFDSTISSVIIGRVQKAFADARDYLNTNTISADNTPKELTPEQETTLKNDFLKNLEISLEDPEYQSLRKHQFASGIEGLLIKNLSHILDQPLIHQIKELEPTLSKGFVLRKLSKKGNPIEQDVFDLSLIQDLEGAKTRINDLALKEVAQSQHLEFLDQKTFDLIKKTTQALLKTNMNYNGIETESRKLRAKASIKNNIIKIKRGESIIRSGDRFEPWHLTVIEGIRQERKKINQTFKIIGTFLFVNLVLFIVYYYSSRYIRRFRPNRKDLVLLGLTLLIFMGVLRLGVFFGSGIKDALPFSISNYTFFYLIPIAGGAMLIRFILNSEVALVFSIVLSLFSGIFLENSLSITIYYLISGVFAAHAITHADKRSSVFIAGIFTGLVNALTILSLNFITVFSSDSMSSSFLVSELIAGFMGGIFAAMSVLIFAPLMEGLFNYTTDIKLLELANLSHPLLREMIVKAPGTYHHSQMVGILAESGADAIGANSLLCRVGSYYHDIGKMKKPQYFIENQHGVNPHDKLSPPMSALIIQAHVKDGLDMAKEHKLPKKIVDLIPEHQGTKLIGYFFNKAKKLAEPDATIDETNYRYDGPRPQTKEAGIVMLADTIEAAVRSMPEKTPTKIQAMVEKLVNQHFVDEQLDECELTLRDLHRISQAFVKILIGIYHQRIEYPEGAVVTNLHPLKAKNDSLQQSASAQANIAPLFKAKGDKDPSAS